MAQNNCPSLQKSLSWCEGAPSHPGIRRRVYFCNKNLIVAYPTLQRDALGRPTSAVLQGNFELQADAYWQFLDINIDKSTVKSDPQGERPSQTQLNKGTFLHNGVGPEATAAASWLNNSDNVYVYEDMLGRFRVLGNNKWATTSKVTQDQGQGTNPASTLIEVEVTDEVAAPFYNGTLETIDGEVSPETVATDENADNTPTVLTTGMILLAPGESKQILVTPNDGNWSFESTNTLVATVTSTGIINAIRVNSKPIGVRCSYNGQAIANLEVLVEEGQGGDPGVDPDTPPAEEDATPSVTQKAITLQSGINTAIIDLKPLNGWTLVTEDSDIAEVSKNNTGKWYVEGNNVGQTKVLAIYGDTMIAIPVKVICPQENNEANEIILAPGESVEFDMLPTSGWHGVFDQIGWTNVEVNGGHVKVTGEIDTDGDPKRLILLNDDGQRLDFLVRVDETNAG